MKRLCFLIILLPFIACEKIVCHDNQLEGTWKMVAVTDHTGSAAITKPTGLPGDVIITLNTSNLTCGKLYGATPSNQINESAFTYTLSGSINIPALSMTKMEETPWGKEFVDNIRSAEKYFFDREHHLELQANQKTLIFQKQ